jgi:hypothetical protein
LGRNFAKFRPEKYVFGPDKGLIFHGRNGPNLPDFPPKKGFEIDRFYDKFQEVAKNIEKF